jgi:hypothetical protein
MISDIFYFYLSIALTWYIILIFCCIEAHLRGVKDIFKDEFLGDKPCLI